MSFEYGRNRSSKIGGCHKLSRAGYEEWAATRVTKYAKQAGQTQ